VSVCVCGVEKEEKEVELRSMAGTIEHSIDRLFFQCFRSIVLAAASSAMQSTRIEDLIRRMLRRHLKTHRAAEREAVPLPSSARERR